MDESKRKDFYNHLKEIGISESQVTALKKQVDSQLGKIDFETAARDKLRDQIKQLDEAILDQLFEVAGKLYSRWEATTALSEVYARLNLIGIYPPGQVEIPGGAVPGTPKQNLDQYVGRFLEMFTYAQSPEKEARLAWFERRRF